MLDIFAIYNNGKDQLLQDWNNPEAPNYKTIPRKGLLGFKVRHHLDDRDVFIIKYDQSEIPMYRKRLNSELGGLYVFAGADKQSVVVDKTKKEGDMGHITAKLNSLHLVTLDGRIIEHGKTCMCEEAFHHPPQLLEFEV